MSIKEESLKSCGEKEYNVCSKKVVLLQNDSEKTYQHTKKWKSETLFMKTTLLSESILSEHKDRVELLLTFYKDVLHYIRMFDLPQEDVEDVIQDTYIEAFTYIEKVRDETKAKYWILKIARRQAIRYMRKEQSRKINEQTLSEHAEYNDIWTQTSTDEQFTQLVKSLDREQLQSLVCRLSLKEQRVLTLYYAYGYKLRDIATILKESDSNVRTISKRSKEKLRKMIENEDIDIKP